MGARRLLAVALAASCSINVLGGNVQKSGLKVPAKYSAQKTAVVGIFNDSYSAYKKYAWGHDDLSPVSLSYSDPFQGWGATIADALDTMYIMGMLDLFEEAVNYTSTIDFSTSKTDSAVEYVRSCITLVQSSDLSSSVFETNIRYVGGYLSAYELSGGKYPVLVEKAEQIAAGLAYAWVGDLAAPYNYVNFTDHQAVVDTTNIAQVGTITLEFGTLTKHTGNATYKALAEKATKAIIALEDPLPGLAAQGYDVTDGTSIGSYVTWGGGSDSYFEYLIKYPRLTNTDDTAYVKEWQLAVDTSIKTLLRNSTVGNFLYLADFDGEDIRHVGSHLACFYGGNWILGGALLNNQTIIDYGLQLTDACWNTYASTLTGIGPETFAFESSDGNYTGGDAPTAAQSAFYNEHGFYITGTDYILRPEVLESNFYAWRYTGNTKYLDNAAAAVASFNKYLPATAGFSGINDVTQANSSRIDDQESFWFAEVLKYLYLTFDEPSHISLDEWVFNTECHPFKAPKAPSSYAPSPSIEPLTTPQPFKVVSGEIPAISPNAYLPVPIKTLLNIP
ncbi:hypothetical protein HWV62_13008 [Athelia sp. TMB]|nr:hypothetical protein HWV62_13008 [Athelia sp. TMB]